MGNKVYSYILGAGASRPDGIPLTYEIVQAAFFNFGGKRDGSDIHLLGTWDKDRVITTVKPVFQIFDQFYGTKLVDNLDGLYKTGYHAASLEISTDMIEGFFTRLYRIVNRIEPCEFLSPDEASKVYKDAAFLFFNTICHEMLGRRGEFYSRFVEKLLRRGGLHNIISFNYDLFLEAALVNNKYLKYDGRQWSYPPELLWTYGIDFINNTRVPYNFPAISDAKIFILKLHGSLNMGYCPVGKEISLYSLHADAWIYGKFHEETIRCSCGEGSHASRPLLIPPINNKEIVVPGLQRQWEIAKDSLSRSHEVHIIGYSLPKTDKEAAILIEGLRKIKIERLVIVNPSSEHSSRLCSMLGDYAGKLVIYKTFEVYLSEELA